MRVCIKHPFDLVGDRVALVQQVTQAVGQSGQDGLGRRGARDHDGLRVECGEDPLDQAGAHPGCALGDDLGELRSTGPADPSGFVQAPRLATPPTATRPTPTSPTSRPAGTAHHYGQSNAAALLMRYGLDWTERQIGNHENVTRQTMQYHLDQGSGGSWKP